MPRETQQAKAARVKKIIAGLKRTYPGAHCELNHSNPLELLVATILSAQCTDKRVNLVTPELFRKYRSAADYAAKTSNSTVKKPASRIWPRFSIATCVNTSSRPSGWPKTSAVLLTSPPRPLATSA